MHNQNTARARVRASRRVTLNNETVETIRFILQVAYGSHEHFLDSGNPVGELGADWMKLAVRYRNVARAASSLGITGEKERWNDLSKCLVQMAR
jgi:hypothetical protein